MDGAGIQAEPGRDTTSATERMSAEASWELDLVNGSLSFQLQDTQDSNRILDVDELVMDPKLKTIDLCFQGSKRQVICKSTLGSLAADLRQAVSAETGFSPRLVSWS